MRTFALEQPVARETGNDAPANDRDQHDGRADGEAPAEPRGHGEAERFEVHQQVGDDEERERRCHRQVAPVASGDDFAGGDGEERGGKRQIGKDRQPRGKVRRNQASKTPEQPEASKRGEAKPSHRQPAGPVRNGGQQEAGHRRHHEAKQHLVDMPRQRIEPRRQLHISEEHREPQSERDNRPASGGEKHRPESVVQHRRQSRAAQAVFFAHSTHAFLRVLLVVLTGTLAARGLAHSSS